ncbi:MAG TPA: ankyrin repeat domain-containing protein [Vicinamibacterales bacterium]|jgi:ankyrin repeat protein|nr:ankyrin repeat domain-containing protein [Vicinamibacterales bacterium]
MRSRARWVALGLAALTGSVWLSAQSPAGTAALDGSLYTAIRSGDAAKLRALITTPADANVRAAEGYTPLMNAASVGSLDAVRFLIDKGADINAQSDSGITALMLADGDLAKQRLLLSSGAVVNLATKMGRSAVFLAAMRDPSADAVRFLVSRGADLKTKDVFGNTLLGAAAAGNDTDTIRMILDAGVDVNTAATTGMTPLMLSAGQRNVEAVTLMIARHANVNAIATEPGMMPGQNPKSGPVALGSYTALLMASAQGPPELIAALLDAGANVNYVESRKLTPLMLAIAADHQRPDVIRLLLARGADPSLSDAQVGTAADWAAKVGAPDGIAILHGSKSQPAASDTQTSAPLDAKSSVERSVALLETSSRGFYEKSGCIGCHAQSMTDLAVAEARLKGARIDPKAAADRRAMYEAASFPPWLLHERGDILVPEIVAYSAAALAASGYPANRLTDSMALNVAATQSRDGAWHQQLGIQERPGAEDGDIFRTALCLHALAAYGPPGRAAEMASRIANAREWLAHASPVTAEDRNMQLLGLWWAGASAASMTPYVTRILAEQRGDGGWPQRDGLGTDAYATGESLYALAKSGSVSPSDARYQRGVRYLLTTQRASDGSWRVPSRSPKFQAFFQSGFPYAGDQWISQWATGWASMALAQAIDAR